MLWPVILDMARLTAHDGRGLQFPAQPLHSTLLLSAHGKAQTCRFFFCKTTCFPSPLPPFLHLCIIGSHSHLLATLTPSTSPSLHPPPPSLSVPPFPPLRRCTSCRGGRRCSDVASGRLARQGVQEVKDGAPPGGAATQEQTAQGGAGGGRGGGGGRGV